MEGLEAIAGVISEETPCHLQSVRRAPTPGRPGPFRSARILRPVPWHATPSSSPKTHQDLRLRRKPVGRARGLDLMVRRGEMVAIMGTSGSGKSTLMNILGCLDYPTSGAYSLDGERVDELDKNQLADIRNQKIGFVFQGFNLLRSDAGGRERGASASLRPDGTASRHPGPRGSGARTGGARRSHGSRTERALGRTAAAGRHRPRARRRSPPILLADEPTGNLDTRTSMAVMTLLQRLNADGMTIILVTHEHDIAGYAERIVELRDGRIPRDHRVAGRQMVV